MSLSSTMYCYEPSRLQNVKIRQRTHARHRGVCGKQGGGPKKRKHQEAEPELFFFRPPEGLPCKTLEFPICAGFLLLRFRLLCMTGWHTITKVRSSAINTGAKWSKHNSAGQPFKKATKRDYQKHAPPGRTILQITRILNPKTASPP